ncbi:glycosyltransferase, partial [Lelliottia amnigena]|uniref:glycosyltransferase n=1 Tax=Lelliottia amnigena TaxID=61646 RepID=UPI001EF7C70C
KPGVTARIAARMAGINKIVHTVHGIAYYAGENIFKKTIYYLLEIIALQFGHYNVTVNDYYLKYYRPFVWKKSIRIYNGVDFANYSFKTEGHKKVSNDFYKKILFVGRLDSQKNPLTALRAFKLLADNRDDVQFDIVGDGELRKQCEEFVKYNKLQTKVIFHGWSNDPTKFYRSADLFFCPSIYEAFGFTFVEAAFNELPIVASNVEGIPEVVKDGSMGLLCSPHDFYEQFKAIEKILFNEKLCKSFGSFGKSYVTSNFSFSEAFESYMRCYNA